MHPPWASLPAARTWRTERAWTGPGLWYGHVPALPCSRRARFTPASLALRCGRVEFGGRRMAAHKRVASVGPRLDSPAAAEPRPSPTRLPLLLLPLPDCSA